ncbi:MAG TPA: carbohydrate kinase family protein [Patescibacteria group bacterium]|nr:carbohydrate kinase family protein [Patescibacteria group bacterium]
MGTPKHREEIKILSIGAAVQDVFLQGKIFTPKKEHSEEVEEFQLGSKNDIEGVVFSTGGGATNGAVTFARHGLHSMFMGKIGNDIAGKAILDDLHLDGVDTSLVTNLKDINTGYSCLLLAPNGERTILTFRGASSHIDIQEVDFNDVETDWIYLTSMAGNFETLAVIFAYAKAHNIKIAMNPGKDELKQPEKLKSLMPDVTILSLNKEEAAMLYRSQSLEELARLANKEVNYVVITDGPHGAIAVDRQHIIAAGMYEEVPVTDRTGAGDAFCSGFTAVIAAGESLERAVTFASANSTSVVTKVGAKAGILPHDAAIHNMPLDVKEL